MRKFSRTDEVISRKKNEISIINDKNKNTQIYK